MEEVMQVSAFPFPHFHFLFTGSWCRNGKEYSEDAKANREEISLTLGLAIKIQEKCLSGGGLKKKRVF